jgi:ribosomal protein S27AE
LAKEREGRMMEQKCPNCNGGGVIKEYDELDRYHVLECGRCDGSGVSAENLQALIGEPITDYPTVTVTKISKLVVQVQDQEYEIPEKMQQAFDHISQIIAENEQLKAEIERLKESR